MKKLFIASIMASIAMASHAAVLGPDNVNTNTQGQAQGQGQAQAQLQGQAQGQLQGQGQAQGNIGIISNDVRQRANSSSGGNSLTVNEAPIPANTNQNIRINDYEVKNVPNVYGGTVYPTAPCMGSSTIGAAGVGFGVNIGTSWTDDECGLRETARSFSGMDMKGDALAILCTSKYAAAAPACKKAVTLPAPVAATVPAKVVTANANCYSDPIVAARMNAPVCK